MKEQQSKQSSQFTPKGTFDSPGNGAMEGDSATSAIRSGMADIGAATSNAASDLASNASKTMQNVGKAVSDQMSSAMETASRTGAQLTNAASDSIGSSMSRLESYGRQNPLVAMGGALLVGIIVGLWGRSRS